MYASVSFPLQSFQTFDYRIPREFLDRIRPGVCVRVELGNSVRVGFVTAVKKTSPFTGEFKDISAIHDEHLSIPEELWNTLEWMGKYYVTPFGHVLRSAIPLSFTEQYTPVNESFAALTEKGKELSQEEINGLRGAAQKKIIMRLSESEEPVRVSKMKTIAFGPMSVCRRLEEKGLLEFIYRPRITDPFDIMTPAPMRDIRLSEEQENAFQLISAGLKRGKFSPFLLHGVTGSGKTEVYLKLAQEAVDQGKSVLVLVPEIALTPQVAKRFRSAFGNRVALWHSAMTKGEKGWTWQQLKRKKYSILVGARSGILAPLDNLGLIIVDEEQDSSYKQESPAPFYHARDVALIRGKFANATVLLTSATPSLESYYNGIREKLTIVRLTERYGNASYPQVKLVDMKPVHRDEKAVSSLLSPLLIEEIKASLHRNEQIILLQNRRGFSQVQQCLNCGHIEECHQCSVTLTYHRPHNQLICHYCDEMRPLTGVCSQCGSEEIKLTGAGTQKVEDEVMRLFPEARIIRMDQDTVRARGAHHRLLQKFEDHEGDILLGTQMIAKGLDFKNVTLVGVINADTGLFMPDFRAGERTFQLVYQVAGRSGRHQKPGKAVIQTYNPDDTAIRQAAKLDLHKFYNYALAERQELMYPPFSRLSRILISGRIQNEVEGAAHYLMHRLKPIPQVTLLGPAPAPVERIQGRWRYHILIKQPVQHPMRVQKHLYRLFTRGDISLKKRGVRIQFIADPVAML